MPNTSLVVGQASLYISLALRFSAIRTILLGVVSIAQLVEATDRDGAVLGSVVGSRVRSHGGP